MDKFWFAANEKLGSRINQSQYATMVAIVSEPPEDRPQGENATGPENNRVGEVRGDEEEVRSDRIRRSQCRVLSAIR